MFFFFWRLFLSLSLSLRSRFSSTQPRNLKNTKLSHLSLSLCSTSKRRVFCADKKYGCGECFPQVSDINAKQADKAAPASSRFGPHGGCTRDFGSFPFRTCSLKKARDPRRPNPSSYDDFDSWVSGALGVEEEAKEEKKKEKGEKEGRKEKGGGG